jgi:hypothetical protein
MDMRSDTTRQMGNERNSCPRKNERMPSSGRDGSQPGPTETMLWRRCQLRREVGRAWRWHRFAVCIAAIHKERLHRPF